MRKLSILVAAIAGIASLQTTAQADTRLSMFRCGKDVVVPRDPVDKVITYCGQPTSVTIVPGSNSASQNSYTKKMYTHSTSESEVWIYNFGPRNTLVEMTFDSGTLRTIVDKGYGY